MTRRPLLALAVALALALVASSAGCAVRDAGTTTTQTREVGDATGVDLATAGRLAVRTGEPASLTLTGGKDLLAHVTSEVVDGVLVIAVDGSGMWRDADLVAELVLPQVKLVRLSGSGAVTLTGVSRGPLALTMDGSGSVEASKVTLDELTVALGGSGTIRASGTCDTQDVSLDGSGTYDAVDLTCTDATVSIGGSGRAEVTVTGTLDASIDGSGEITYDGGAVVTQEVSGSGRITQR